MAGTAVHIITFSQKGLATDGLLAFKAGETLFVPDFILVFHILRTWHNQFVAGLAARGVLASSAFITHDLSIISGSKLLVGQRLGAFGATEAALVPVAVLVSQLLCIDAYRSATFSAGVGAEFVKAAHAHVLIIFVDVFFTLQVIFAVKAVKAICHSGGRIAAGTSEWR